MNKLKMTTPTPRKYRTVRQASLTSCQRRVSRLRCLMATIIVIATAPSYAACSLTPAQQNLHFDLGNLAISNDSPSGAVIYTTSSQTSGTITRRCQRPTDPVLDSPMYSMRFGRGIRFAPQMGSAWGSLHASNNVNWKSTLRMQANMQIPSTTHALQISKWGQAVNPGVVNYAEIGVVSIPDGRGGASAIRFTASYTITQPTCAISTGDQSVSLGNMSAGGFAGDQGGPWKNFSVSFSSCSNVGTINFATSTGEADANKTGFYRISSTSGAAQGVAIELSRNEGSNTNAIAPGASFSVGTGGAANVTARFRARYRQTLNTVKPGSANGAISFTVTYS
ncbi:fimbrial protein [Paraherbaspirillum soli]|uniref:Fimbrial protein n=1 Tax=Paraherbaspirillum soli TaxID=631222 RepID=A0ABW0MAU4_9BURK